MNSRYPRRLFLAFAWCAGALAAAQAQTLFVPGGAVGTSANGNVGIGTNNPWARLFVTAPNATSGTYVAAGDGIYGVLEVGVPNTVDSKAFLSLHRGGTVVHQVGISGQDLVFACGGGASSLSLQGETVRITSAGNIGIGTAAPEVKLDVIGNIRARGAGFISDYAAPEGGHLQLHNTSKTGATTHNWTLWNMTGGYGNGLSFWRYNADGTNPGPSVWFGDNGRVGIGTTSPDQLLTVKGGGIGFDHNSSDKKLYSPVDGVLEWMTHSLAGEKGFAVSHQGERRVFLSIDGNSYFNGGNVGIGTASPTHKLSVNGSVKAKEVIVETTGWADDVFADDYPLAPLSEIEAHIKAEKRLPGIPSEAEVAEAGVNLGDMQALLLRKIEELTLHQIRQEKSQADQAELIQTLRRENAQLHDRIQQLERKP